MFSVAGVECGVAASEIVTNRGVMLALDTV